MSEDAEIRYILGAILDITPAHSERNPDQVALEAGHVELFLVGLLNPDGRRLIERQGNYCHRGTVSAGHKHSTTPLLQGAAVTNARHRAAADRPVRQTGPGRIRGGRRPPPRWSDQASTT